MITLRPYQDDCLNGIREHVLAGLRKVILCGPTGCGKTRMFSYMVSEHLSAKRPLENKALVLSNRVELLTQSGGALHDLGIRPERISADNKHINKRARCYVGMVETYYNRLKTMPELAKMTLIIIDECHYSSYNKVILLLEEMGFNGLIVGCTATPISAKKNDPLSNYYQALVNRVQIADLIEQGFLSPCITYSAKIDRSKLRKDNTGDYSDQSQMDTFATRTVYNGLLQRYQEMCNRYNQGFPMKTICFNVNVAHSLEVTDMFNQAGIPCKHVDGTTPIAERESIIAGYKSGAFPIICNVGILNAGFDDPTTSCIIMNRATTSVPLWLQSCGRGSRIAEGKDRFIILDMGDNWTELGLWEAERDWESLWNQSRKKSDKAGVAPVKTCDSCGALVKLQSSKCDECGYEFPKKEKEFAEATEFVEVTKDMVPEPKFSQEEARELMLLDRASKWGTLDVATLEKLREYRGRKTGWPIHVIREASQTEEEFRDKIKQLAQLRGYRSGWVQHQEWKPQLQYAS